MECPCEQSCSECSVCQARQGGVAQAFPGVLCAPVAVLRTLRNSKT